MKRGLVIRIHFELTTVCIGSTEHADVGDLVVLVFLDGVLGFAEAARMHPFLAKTFALKHFLLVVLVVRLLANTETFRLT